MYQATCQSRITPCSASYAICSETVAVGASWSRLVKELADRNEAKVGKEAYDWEVTGTSGISHTLRTIELWMMSFEVSAPLVTIKCYNSMGMVGAPLACFSLIPSQVFRIGAESGEERAVRK